MISSSKRLYAGAVILLTLSSASTSPAQSRPLSLALPSRVLIAALPDAPSYSSSQPQTTPGQTTQHPGETEDQRKAREVREEAEREVKAEEKQRVGGVMPQFNVVISGKAVQLTAKQKFDLSYHTIIDPYTFGLAIFIGGGYGELTDDHTGYGHGPAGFFKRTAASYADNVIGNVVGNAALPVLFHQDPRYFRKGEGSIKSRIIYSALTTFICRSDKGRNQFNISNVLGNFIAGGVSNAYYPSDERGVGLTITNGAIVTAEGMAGAQILEFSPDITNKIKRHRQRVRDERAAAAAAAVAAQQKSAPQP